MPSRREVAEAVAILTGGRIAQAAYGAATRVPMEVTRFRDLTRAQQARAAGLTAVRGGKFVGRQAVTKNPWGIAGLLAYEGYIRRDEIADLAESLAGGEIPSVDIPGVRGSAVTVGKKRALSKANRAVAYGMKLLKAGTKGTTGAPKGELAKGSFKVATQAAGLANPKTGGSTKGKGKTKALARKIKGWW